MWLLGDPPHYQLWGMLGPWSLSKSIQIKAAQGGAHSLQVLKVRLGEALSNLGWLKCPC